jgi:hypothetical protein
MHRTGGERPCRPHRPAPRTAPRPRAGPPPRRPPAIRAQGGGADAAGGMAPAAPAAARGAPAACLVRAHLAAAPELLAPLLRDAVATRGACGRVYVHIQGAARAGGRRGGRGGSCGTGEASRPAPGRRWRGARGARGDADACADARAHPPPDRARPAGAGEAADAPLLAWLAGLYCLVADLAPRLDVVPLVAFAGWSPGGGGSRRARARQGRAGQGRAGQGRAGQGRAGQGRERRMGGRVSDARA